MSKPAAWDRSADRPKLKVSELSAVKRLSNLVAKSDNQLFRQRAIRALGQTGSSSAVKPLLQALTRSSNDSERVLIVSALTGLRSIEAVMPLKTLLQESDNARLHTQIVIALGAIDDIRKRAFLSEPEAEILIFLWYKSCAITM